MSEILPIPRWIKITFFDDSSISINTTSWSRVEGNFSIKHTAKDGEGYYEAEIASFPEDLIYTHEMKEPSFDARHEWIDIHEKLITVNNPVAILRKQDEKTNFSWKLSDDFDTPLYIGSYSIKDGMIIGSEIADSRVLYDLIKIDEKYLDHFC